MRAPHFLLAGPSRPAHAASVQGANPESDQDSDFWGYQYCTEMFMPFAKDGGGCCLFRLVTRLSLGA